MRSIRNKKRKIVLRFVLFVISLLLFACSNPESSKLTGSRPNIIFILADDMGWADLPVYGNKFNEAPVLTKMAEEGIRFTNAYAACPVCSPSRAAIMSGQYPARVGIIDFITGHWRPYEELVVPKNRIQYLPLEIYTLGELMKDAGYVTGYFGKWHLGRTEKYYPKHQGFDVSNVYKGGGYFNVARKLDPNIDVAPDILLSKALTKLSLDFIDKNKDKPFFLSLDHFDVHVQLDADSSAIQKYLHKEKVAGYPCNAVYAAMVENVDNSVGEILNKLKELHLDKKTIVFFFSDNGGLISRFDKIPLIDKSKRYIYEGDTLLYIATSNLPLRGEKGTLYEGGIREPLIAWWPGKIKSGTVSDAIITGVDFFPTFAELAGIKLPDYQVFDGKSFINVLEGRGYDKNRAIYWHYPVYHHSVPASAVRKGDWKLIHFLNDNHKELYNLKEDIGETEDVSGKFPEKVNELYQLLDMWRKSCNAAMPVKNWRFDPARRYEWGRPNRRAVWGNNTGSK